MKKLLSLIAILLLAISQISCEAEEAQLTNNNIVEEPGVENIVPDWLEAEYSSAIFPNEDHSYITEEDMHLNFLPYNEGALYFSLEDVQTEETSDTFTVHYYDGADIIFRRNSELNDQYIKITFINNGVTKEFGVFNKVNN